jgi:hypothetical protein
MSEEPRLATKQECERWIHIVNQCKSCARCYHLYDNCELTIVNGIKHYKGQCRRYPPTNTEHRYPQVNWYDYCGEFEAIEDLTVEDVYVDDYDEDVT